MKHKKILIISIIVITVLVIAIGGFAFAYMTTDILKTDEQLFYKYIMAVGNDISTFNSENLQNYLTKTQTTPYENDGVLTVNVDIPGTTPSDLDMVNDMNITFKGKTDKANNLSEQAININYSDNVTFPILYKHTGNTYGMTSEKVINGSEIIAIKNENLSELAEKLGINLGISNEIEMSISNLSLEQLVNEFPKLQQIVLNNLTKENFSKVDASDFMLTLTEKQFVNILLQMVDEIKQSGILPQSIVDAIDQSEDNIQEDELSDDAYLKIVINKDKKVVVSVQEEIVMILTSKTGEVTIQLTDAENAPVIKLQKTENANNASYQISFMQASNEISFTMNYTNLQAQTVNEDYLLTISVATSEDEEDDQRIEYQYNFNTVKTFVDAVEVEEINSDNAFIVNERIDEYGAETIKALFQQIGMTIMQVNNGQMQELGVSTNPLIFATPIGIFYNSIYSSAHNAIGSQEALEENAEIISFNSKFLNYEGIQKGSSTKALIDIVITNNKDISGHIVSVNGYTDEASLQNLKSQLNTSAEYNVAFNYNSEGYINSIIIAAK